MIDLQEPQRPSYSEADKEMLQEKFALILHSFLLLYLSAHNFLIPLITNILRGAPLLEDMHFWFLFQLPVQYLLRKGQKIPLFYLHFLIMGTIARMGVELTMASQLKSWPILSVMLSELSSSVFYFVYYPHAKKVSRMSLAILGPVIAILLSWTEVHSPATFKRSSLHRKLTVADDYHLLGCQGSLADLSFPLTQYSARNSVQIKSCGFEQALVYHEQGLVILNQFKHPVNLRLYRLNVLHGRVKWKFVRLVKVEEGKSWDVSSLLKQNEIYVIKSPERRKLGHLVILPAGGKEFPLGAGELELTYDTIKWSSHGT